MFSNLGAPGTGTEAILGVCFLFLAILISFSHRRSADCARAEEADSTLDHILQRPVSRSRWLFGRLGLASIVLVISGIGAGSFAWLGTVSQDSGIGISTLLAAGDNLVPPSLAVLGIGVLVFGVWPRATSIAIYSLLGWSVLVVIIGGFGCIHQWILDTSVFHQMTSAPAVEPDWEANVLMTIIGVSAALLGGFAFSRRDLQGE